MFRKGINVNFEAPSFDKGKPGCFAGEVLFMHLVWLKSYKYHCNVLNESTKPFIAKMDFPFSSVIAYNVCLKFESGYSCRQLIFEETDFFA